LITTKGARVGDAILLTKGIPIEAVSIIARERTNELQHRYSSGFVARVHAMHDPTEGGLSAALYELAEAADVGILIDESKVRILPEGAQLCSDFGLNPWGAIASGALLICADPRREATILRRLHRANIDATRVGTVLPPPEGVRMMTKKGRLRKVPRFAVDEMARFMSI
jgi:hydrogenase maturation factor